MTEKPNSVTIYCKCFGPVRQVTPFGHLCNKCGYLIEPVAEPAEPSALVVSLPRSTTTQACTPVSAEPIAECYRTASLRESMDEDSTQAAPQPVAHYLKACVAEGPDCACVGICKFDARPVAEEGPQDWNTPEFAELAMGFAKIGKMLQGPERHIMNQIKKVFYEVDAERAAKLAEGTPKLEELVEQIINALLACPYTMADWRTTIVDILRPFITPACQVSGGNTMEYQVVTDKLTRGDWRVEAINHAGEGECFVTIFSGPDSETRAKEYATWKNQ